MDHDFKASLEAIRNPPTGYALNCVFRDENVETIKTALRIADRLQNGDVSAEMVAEAYEAPPYNGSFRFGLEYHFKIMAAQLLKEEADE